MGNPTGQSGHCRIGIFWMVNGELITQSRPQDSVRPVDGIRDVDDEHYSYWEVLQRQRPKLCSYAYDFFPRGRVVYRDRDATFLIYVDRCLLKDSKTMARLLKAFSLPVAQFEFRSDSHYQCSACNPEYLSDTPAPDDANELE